ncbi:uncharacterized protein LOC18434692 isoform X2 [Amborella trichopoda]|uniref:uncharacterized protein LOC18434692 isoform X2 n=1 Tax=Amborella trichopoda TaxID=13333 RepID=UPI0009BF4F7D|nr:uncharacterized protein LOC18434692 isoform X2 [Amborella trichopoda]|eukprot:XP_020523226.1 uncharacterized protein LOC18434692 isoform X2 [Amborella trichopoda]
MAASEFSRFTQLNEPKHFDAIATPDGFFSICGFGSLLSERSARGTFPGLRNFRIAALRDFRRIYAHVAAFFYDRGIAKEDTKEISSMSTEPCPGGYLIITVFEVPKSEAVALMERESEFRYIVVIPEELDGKPFTHPAVLCARYSDEEFFHERCKGNKDIYFKHYGRVNIYQIWRNDILPCRVYLRHCDAMNRVKRREQLACCWSSYIPYNIWAQFCCHGGGCCLIEGKTAD